MLIVKKFGGKLLNTKERIFKVVNICKEDYEKGNDIILVLSAIGEKTDELIENATNICEDFEKREMDMLLVTGEQIAVSLVSMAFSKENIPAVSLNAFQIPIYTDSNYTDAEIVSIGTKRIKQELSKGNIVIVTGFQGIDKENNYTTLGRGGSDTTAVAIAAKFNADKCEIYKDVDGVYDTDPKANLYAKKYDEIGYDEMLNLSNSGAKVLHNKSVEIAKKCDVPIFIKSMFTNEIGTVIKSC
ncbi:MAG: aspartate kinase [Clostridia bacterium]|nr:aspartate kinase [Clostridia bacterium]